jgi:putative nucleotidyltransferase with HDIG domain
VAIEIDRLWGQPDGRITVDELERVARYYLAALPFFTKEAGALLELAEHLGFADDRQAAPAAKNVLSLRLAMAEVDKGEVARGQAFRALFDEALRAHDDPARPGLLRDVALHQPKWHRLSILEHTAVAVAAIKTLATSMGLEWKDAGAVMLLHDIGKVLERQTVTDPDGRDRHAFWGHEGVGARWLASRGLSPDLVFHVNHHGDLRAIGVEDMVALCGTKERLAQAIVVYVADQVAKGDTPDQLASFAREWPKIEALCAHAGLDSARLAETRSALIQHWFGHAPPG